jgi:hypothetical protein
MGEIARLLLLVFALWLGWQVLRLLFSLFLLPLKLALIFLKLVLWAVGVFFLLALGLPLLLALALPLFLVGLVFWALLKLLV